MVIVFVRKKLFVREKLLKVVGELFYDYGIIVIGIDVVIVWVGVVKMLLYNNFKFKFELVVVYIDV